VLEVLSGTHCIADLTHRRTDNFIYFDSADMHFGPEHIEASGANIVHLIYQKKQYVRHVQDHEFSGTSMREHWQSGYADTVRTLCHAEWLARSSIRRGVAVHDLHREDPT
jgi:hypothetical protein